MLISSLFLCLWMVLHPTKPEAPVFQSELIAPPESLHNHGSCIVETPKGNLLVCWYRGSGERGADDVQVMGSRRQKGKRQWSERFVMQDTPGFPDTNPCMIIDQEQRLWLFWGNVLDNHWETALTQFKISRKFEQSAGSPLWETQRVLFTKPGAEFLKVVERDLPKQWEPYRKDASPAELNKLDKYVAERLEWAKVPAYVRMGWMTRAHPTLLSTGRLLVPLYSDRFDFSLIAITDDGGNTWKFSEPLVGAGNVQPSIVQRKDGTLVAYFRDNGLAPQRVMVSESHDSGMTWSYVQDTEMWNPGAGLEAIVLKSGNWLLVNNDTEQGRHRLALHLSQDEGKTWRVARYLEKDEHTKGAGSYSYPSIMQAKEGKIHVTYSYTPNAKNAEREGKGETIKHAEFNEAWVLAGIAD